MEEDFDAYYYNNIHQNNLLKLEIYKKCVLNKYKNEYQHLVIFIYNGYQLNMSMNHNDIYKIIDKYKLSTIIFCTNKCENNINPNNAYNK